MRLMMFFKTKDEAEKYRQEHPIYREPEYEKRPMIDSNGDELHWSLVAIVD